MQPQRRSIRLTDYDYTLAGAYFVTVCGYARQSMFGAITDGVVCLNACGRVIREEWERTAIVRPNIDLDAFVIMPNHIHGTIVITHSVEINPARATRWVAPTLPANSLGAIIGQFKSPVTKRIQRLPDAPTHPIWQRNYYEHIIRNAQSLDQIRAYIENNPSNWTNDALYNEP